MTAAAAAAPAGAGAQEPHQAALPLAEAARGLVLQSSAPGAGGEPAGTAARVPWSAASGPLWAGAPLTHFTPRFGGLGLGPTVLGLVGPGPSRREVAITVSAPGGTDGDGLVPPLSALGLAGADTLELSLSAGFAAGPAGLWPGEGWGRQPSEVFGLEGRLGIGGLSLGAVAERGTGGVMLGLPGHGAGAGYDLSYAFGVGAVSLSRFRGRGEAALGGPVEGEHETLTLSGRYVIGPNLDMMALLAHRTAADDDPEGATVSGRWTLVTGVRFSF